MSLYRDVAEAYLLISIVVSPLLCIFGWVLLSKAVNRHLHTYIHWFTPAIIAGSLTTSAVLLEAFVRFYALRDYTLAAGVYLLTLAGLPFHVVSFVRLWKIISALPPSPCRPPHAGSINQDETVCPPQPRQPS